MQLHLHPTDPRFFLVPADADLPTGAQEIVALNGARRMVNPEVLASFEVSEEQARAHLEAQVGQGLGQVLAVLGTLLPPAPAAPGAAIPSGSLDLTSLARLFDLAPEQLRRDPAAARPALARLAEELRLTAIVSADPSPAAQSAARRRARRLAARLRRGGIDPGPWIEQLPEQLAAIARIDRAGAAPVIAARVEAFVQSLAAGKEDLGRRLDALVEDLEHEFGDRRDQERQRYERAKASAAADIAAALRAHGLDSK